MTENEMPTGDRNADAARIKRMMSKIQALWDRAEHPATPGPEADLCRAKAEQLMNDYRIAESDLAKNRTADSSAAVPVRERFTVCDNSSPYADIYHSLMWYIARHTGVRYWQTIERNAAGGRDVVGYLVGFEVDIRFAEMLFLSCRQTFSSTMEPKPDPRLGDAENVYALRSSGMERNRIANLLWGSSMTDGAAHGKVTKLYKAECAKRGEDPKVVGRTVNAKTYRSSFADGFVSQIRSRLHRMRDAAATVNTGLVLHGRKEIVDEAFYTFYPSQRPKPEIEMRPEKDCERCAKSKRGACASHYIPMGSYRESAYSEVGASAGRSAANAANLGRSTGEINR